MIVVSANLDGYDSIKRPPTGGEVTAAYLHTDREQEALAAGWLLAPTPRNPCLPPRFRAKAPKVAPQLCGHHEIDVLWIDGSLAWTGEALETLLEQVPEYGVGCFLHRFRGTVLEEAETSDALPRYAGQPVVEQARHYATLPEHLRDAFGAEGARSFIGRRTAPLFETGIVVWRGAQHYLGVRWAAEILAWTDQDQVSFPYAAAVTSTAVTPLLGLRGEPANVIENPWFVYHHHLRDDAQVTR